MMKKASWHIHLALVVLALLTLVPFFFAVNTLFRSNAEFYHSFFAFPESIKSMVCIALDTMTGTDKIYIVRDDEGRKQEVGRGRALAYYVERTTRGTRMAWAAIRPFLFNTFLVCGLSAFGVIALGSAAAYILARYRFLGHKVVFTFIISTMMFPGVLTLVPSFLLVKSMGLLNTYWAMVLPFVAGGQVFAIYVFKSFFEGLPEDLFEAARIDGAGHVRIYWNIVLPLSKPVFAVVLVMNVLGTWNNFLWPFIVNPDGERHMIASGLFVMANSAYASNIATMYAAYAISSLPLLLLLVVATKPFIQGITAGAFKA